MVSARVPTYPETVIPRDNDLDPQRVRDEVLEVMAERADAEHRRAVSLVLRGTVRQGVEWRSVVLHTDDGRTFQLGGAYAGYEGREVRVVGRPRLDMATTAQEGVPLTVDSLDVLSR